MVNLQNKPGTGTQAFYQADKDTGSGFGNNTGLRRPGVFQGAAELLRQDLKDQLITDNLVQKVGINYFPNVTNNGYLLHIKIKELLTALGNRDHHFTELKTAPSVLLNVCLQPKMLEVWGSRDSCELIKDKLSFGLAYEAVTILRSAELRSKALRDDIHNSGTHLCVSANSSHRARTLISEKKTDSSKSQKAREDVEKSVNEIFIAIAEGKQDFQPILLMQSQMGLNEIFTVDNTYKFLASAIDVITNGQSKSGNQIKSEIIGFLELLRTNSLFDINGADSKGKTLLMVAALLGNEHLIEALKEFGADPTLKDLSGQTAAVYATKSGYNQISKLLEEDTCRFNSPR